MSPKKSRVSKAQRWSRLRRLLLSILTAYSCDYMNYLMLFMRTALIGFLALNCNVTRAGAYEEMLEAIKKDDAPAVSQLLKRGMDVNSADAQGNSWLILAAR